MYPGYQVPFTCGASTACYPPRHRADASSHFQRTAVEAFLTQRCTSYSTAAPTFQVTMLGGDGVLPSGVALASEDSFAPMMQLRRAAVQLFT